MERPSSETRRLTRGRLIDAVGRPTAVLLMRLWGGRHLPRLSDESEIRERRRLELLKLIDEVGAAEAARRAGVSRSTAQRVGKVVSE